MTAQLERLIQDSKQLEAYIVKVKRKGKTDLASKLSKKQQFLNQTIAEFKQQVH
jgi:phage shock protein A